MAHLLQPVECIVSLLLGEVGLLHEGSQFFAFVIIICPCSNTCKRFVNILNNGNSDFIHITTWKSYCKVRVYNKRELTSSTSELCTVTSSKCTVDVKIMQDTSIY